MKALTQSPGRPRGWQTFPLPNASHAKQSERVEFVDLLPYVLMSCPDEMVLAVSRHGLILGTIKVPVWFDELADRLGVPVLGASASARLDGFCDCLLLREESDTLDQYFERLRKLAEIALPAKTAIADRGRAGDVLQLP